MWSYVDLWSNGLYYDNMISFPHPTNIRVFLFLFLLFYLYLLLLLFLVLFLLFVFCLGSRNSLDEYKLSWVQDSRWCLEICLIGISTVLLTRANESVLQLCLWQTFSYCFTSEGLWGRWVNEHVLLHAGISLSQSLKFSQGGLKVEAFQWGKSGNNFGFKTSSSYPNCIIYDFWLCFKYAQSYIYAMLKSFNLHCGHDIVKQRITPQQGEKMQTEVLQCSKESRIS